MNRFTIFLLLCVGLMRLGYAQTTMPKFAATDVKADLRYLYETLAASHYNLYANTPKRVYDKAYQELYRSIQDSLTPLQINRLFQPFVAKAQLGHCVTGYPFKSYNAFLANGGRVFPFDVRVNKRHMYVVSNHSTDTTIHAGDEILALYGVNMSQWLTRIYRYLSGENEYYKNTLIDLVGFPRLFWMVYDQTGQFSIKIKRTDGRVVFVNTPGMLASSYRDIRNRQPALFTTSRQLNFIENIAYLRPGQFLNSESSGNTSRQETFQKGEFIQFIDSAFVQMHRRKINQLLIDLRGNPGGDNTFSDYMVAYFATRPFSFYSTFRVKTSAVTKSFWRNVTDSSLANLKRDILSTKDGEQFAVNQSLYPNREDSLRFKGNVYVLIDRYTYSNAATTAAQIQDYRFGTLLGEPTAESPTLYASVHEFELPKTKTEVTYPKAFMIRPSGNPLLRGVTPNIIASEKVLMSSDDVLKFALNYIHQTNK